MDEDRSAQVAELSEKLVRLAKMLSAAEAMAAEVRAELGRLDLADCVAEDFEQLVIPRDAAERLQDGLDQLAGELDNEARRRARAARGEPGPFDRPAGPLRVADPITEEELRVRCSACNRPFASPVAADATQLASVSIDERTYTCPHCGHTDCYEVWDHYIE